MYIIDGEKMTGRMEAHEELMRALELPEYYGKNLDALWDVLTSMKGEIRMTNTGKMLSALEIYGYKLLQTIREAAEKNKELTFTQD